MTSISGGTANMDDALRILVVDDEETIRDILSRVLGREGYDVTVARSGEEALEILLTDIRMEGMSGMDLLTEIRGMNAETQVIIMTSYASLETAIQALRSGAYDYLVKPFEDLDLVAATIFRATEKIRMGREIASLIGMLKEKNEELEAKNKLLSAQVAFDGLTELHNHRFFQEALATEVSRSRRHGHSFSLVFMDIDAFKTYNDTHGHLKGDVLLRTMGEILKGTLRKGDMPARYGGDEFVVLLPETGKEAGHLVAEKVRNAIASHPFYGREVQPGGVVSVSVGVASFPADGGDAASVLRKADQALYESKSRGRNTVSLAS
jgi:diguanylate cyclase (GGDEF)-like protein